MNRFFKSIGGGYVFRLASSTLASGLLLAPSSARAEIAYENVSIPFELFYCDTREFGDEINLGTAGTTVTKLQFEYYGYFEDNGSQTLRVRCYANDGEGNDSSVGVFGKPKTVLYDSGELMMTSGYNVVSLTNLAFAVKERFTWTVKFEGVSGKVGDRAGLLLFNPPEIGSSFNDFWIKTDANGWETFLFPGGNPVSNFGARVETTPATLLEATSQEVQSDGSLQFTLTGPVFSEAALETALPANTNQWTRLQTFLFLGSPIVWKDQGYDAAANPLYRLVPTTEPLLSLDAPVLLDGYARVKMTATPGKTAVIEGSDNLTKWDRVKTNYFTAAQYSFVDSQTPKHEYRFYRGWFANDMDITILSYERKTNGMVSLSLFGPPGKDCVIKTSTDLIHWNVEADHTFSFTGGTIHYLDTTATNATAKFYKAVLAQ
jgi:hypothetical protein